LIYSSDSGSSNAAFDKPAAGTHNVAIIFIKHNSWGDTVKAYTPNEGGNMEGSARTWTAGDSNEMYKLRRSSSGKWEIFDDTMGSIAYTSDNTCDDPWDATWGTNWDNVYTVKP
jgi:hypothetical protein